MKLFDLTGKVALVTGGNGGIGLGMAQGMAVLRRRIMITGRNAAKAEPALAALRALGVDRGVPARRRHPQAACVKLVADTVATSAGWTSW